jgi:hypothetical protein
MGAKKPRNNIQTKKRRNREDEVTTLKFKKNYPLFKLACHKTGFYICLIKFDAAA